MTGVQTCALPICFPVTILLMACPVRYPHGLIIGIVVEMKFNGNMRFKASDPTYYPYEDADDWAYRPYNLTGYESFLINLAI